MLDAEKIVRLLNAHQRLGIVQSIFNTLSGFIPLKQVYFVYFTEEKTEAQGYIVGQCRAGMNKQSFRCQSLCQSWIKMVSGIFSDEKLNFWTKLSSSSTFMSTD